MPTPNLDKLTSRDFWSNNKTKMYGIVDGGRLSDDLHAQLDPHWLRNFNKNLETINGLPLASEYFNAWTGEDALIVAAGPSAQEKPQIITSALDMGMKVIAIDRTFNMLKRSGITPDVTISMDASAELSHYVSRALLEPTDTFLLNVFQHPNMYGRLRRCHRYVWGTYSPYSRLMQTSVIPKLTCGEKISLLLEGGTITASAVDFAIWTGARRIITIGNDLGFKQKTPLLEKMYPGALYEVKRSNGEIFYTIPAFIMTSTTLVALAVIYPDGEMVTDEVEFIDCSGNKLDGWQQVEIF